MSTKQTRSHICQEIKSCLGKKKGSDFAQGTSAVSRFQSNLNKKLFGHLLVNFKKVKINTDSTQDRVQDR